MGLPCVSLQPVRGLWAGYGVWVESLASPLRLSGLGTPGGHFSLWL
jgi:hypothetical protein